jgi:hypothetical protein
MIQKLFAVLVAFAAIQILAADNSWGTDVPVKRTIPLPTGTKDAHIKSSSSIKDDSFKAVPDPTNNGDDPQNLESSGGEAHMVFPASGAGAELTIKFKSTTNSNAAITISYALTTDGNINTRPTAESYTKVAALSIDFHNDGTASLFAHATDIPVDVPLTNIVATVISGLDLFSSPNWDTISGVDHLLADATIPAGSMISLGVLAVGPNDWIRLSADYQGGQSSVASIPEPSSIALLAIGSGYFLARIRRKVRR